MTRRRRARRCDCAGGALHFDSREASYGQFHDAATGQEILTQLDPLRRYGIGVLYGGAEVRGTAARGRAAARRAGTRRQTA